MASKLQAIRGMNDILPPIATHWRFLEEQLIACLTQYGYQEIRFPLLESTQLFKRSIGEVTDIVEKEMYSFQDLNGESITLRPEGTASCLRACLEHGLLHNQQQKLWYLGPMFRHEKPQKGRYRQFTQLGVEAFGFPATAAELELIALCQRFWLNLGMKDEIHLEINSLGELQERNYYKEKLVSYFETCFNLLDEESQRRLYKNPLRILDSKNPTMQDLIKKAPKLMDVLGKESRHLFDALCEGLTELGIDYVINPLLVRGLDYYGHTVFEWITSKLGSQATVCAGGRYDVLIEHLGGKPTSAVGFAMGIERLYLLLETINNIKENSQEHSVYIIVADEKLTNQALVLAESIRTACPGYQVQSGFSGSLKSQFKKADKSGASIAVILGEDEAKEDKVGLKFLRRYEAQVNLPRAELFAYLNTLIDAQGE